MRIFHLITHFSLGGAERVAANIAESQTPGMEYHVVEIMRGRTAYTPKFIGELEKAGVRCHRSWMPDVSFHFLFERIAALLFPLRMLCIMLRWRPDVIHTHTETPDLALYVFSRVFPRMLRRVKIVRTIHNTRLWTGLPRTAQWVEAFFKSRNANIAISDSVRDSYAERFGEVAPIINNGVAEVEQEDYFNISTPQGVHLSQVHQQHLTTSTSHHNNTSLACDIAALLEEKDPLSESGGTDLTLRLSALRAARRKKQLGRWQRIAKIAAEYRRMAHTDEDNRDPAPTEAGLLVAYAYPERIAHSTNSIGGYRLASGANVQLDAADQQSAHSWLAIASLYSAPGTTGRVFLAAPIAPDDLEKEFVKEVDNIAWDTKQGCVVMQREQRIGKLMLSQKPIHDADKERLKGIVCEAMKKDGLTMMAWSEKAVEQVQRRVAQVAAWHPEMALPDVSTEYLLSTVADWLPFYLEEGGRVKTSVQELRKLNLAEIIWNILPYEAQLEVDRLAPTHIEVPTGSHIRIDYRSGAEAPVLSVRLQECFGMERTPCVDDGRQPLLMELLSPGFKPVQLTQDLASFWQGTYFEVRKELRRRYPKHYWPENPLEAEAVRGVKRK